MDIAVEVAWPSMPAAFLAFLVGVAAAPAVGVVRGRCAAPTGTARVLA